MFVFPKALNAFQGLKPRRSIAQVKHPDEQHRAGVIMELGLILGIFAGGGGVAFSALGDRTFVFQLGVRSGKLWFACSLEVVYHVKQGALGGSF